MKDVPFTDNPSKFHEVSEYIQHITPNIYNIDTESLIVVTNILESVHICLCEGTTTMINDETMINNLLPEVPINMY